MKLWKILAILSAAVTVIGLFSFIRGTVNAGAVVFPALIALLCVCRLRKG